MEQIKIININSNADDIKIVSGEYLNIINGTRSYEHGVLSIETTDDLELVLPEGEYECINITTSAGDAEVKVRNAIIGRLDFNSDCGDLVVDGPVKEIFFNSPAGEYVRRGGISLKKPLKSQTRTTKTNLPKLPVQGEDWVSGERYK